MHARIYSQSRRPRRVVNDNATFRFADDPATLSRHVPAWPLPHSPPRLKRTARSRGTRIISRLARPAISPQRKREENSTMGRHREGIFRREGEKPERLRSIEKRRKEKKKKSVSAAASVKLFTPRVSLRARASSLYPPAIAESPCTHNPAAFQRTF